MIHVIKPGVFTTVQDLGRPHFAHLGVSPSGAADSVSFRIANLLVGNDANAAALEITLVGPTLEFESATVIAVSGARTNTRTRMNEAFEVSAGSRINLGPLVEGARAYVAVRGGMSVPTVMGSCSTFVPARIGGLEGRALRAGDRLGVGDQTRGPCRKLPSDLAEMLRTRHEAPIRVTPSLQADWFEEATLSRFHQQVFTVSDDSNRSGIRLTGEPIQPKRKGELLTEGVPLGAIQIPPDGQPIILFVDQQTTGGYPKIANVIAADLPRVGQLRPRDQVRFQLVTIAEAIELLRQQEDALARAFEL